MPILLNSITINPTPHSLDTTMSVSRDHRGDPYDPYDYPLPFSGRSMIYDSAALEVVCHLDPVHRRRAVYPVIGGNRRTSGERFQACGIVNQNPLVGDIVAI